MRLRKTTKACRRRLLTAAADFVLFNYRNTHIQLLVFLHLLLAFIALTASIRQVQHAFYAFAGLQPLLKSIVFRLNRTLRMIIIYTLASKELIDKLKLP